MTQTYHLPSSIILTLTAARSLNVGHSNGRQAFLKRDEQWEAVAAEHNMGAVKMAQQEKMKAHFVFGPCQRNNFHSDLSSSPKSEAIEHIFPQRDRISQTEPDKLCQ
jgi:hypothetical protein